jgi:hypothetical protein
MPLVGATAGSVRSPSTAVTASGIVANGWRSFWPLPPTMCRALAAGLKSTPKCSPSRSTVS